MADRGEILRTHDQRRKEWARRLHSTASQQLAAIRLNLAMLQNLPLPERESRALRESIVLAESCAREIQKVIAELHPPLLDTFGLIPALQELTERAGASFKAESADLKLTPDIEIGIYRLVEDMVSETKSPRIGLLIARSGDVLSLNFQNATEITAEAVERCNELNARYELLPAGVQFTIPIKDVES
jgi:signal transduction histidine kinase